MRSECSRPSTPTTAMVAFLAATVAFAVPPSSTVVIQANSQAVDLDTGAWLDRSDPAFVDADLMIVLDGTAADSATLVSPRTNGRIARHDGRHLTDVAEVPGCDGSSEKNAFVVRTERDDCFRVRLEDMDLAAGKATLTFERLGHAAPQSTKNPAADGPTTRRRGVSVVYSIADTETVGDVEWQALSFRVQNGSGGPLANIELLPLNGGTSVYGDVVPDRGEVEMLAEALPRDAWTHLQRRIPVRLTYDNADGERITILLDANPFE